MSRRHHRPFHAAIAATFVILLMIPTFGSAVSPATLPEAPALPSTNILVEDEPAEAAPAGPPASPPADVRAPPRVRETSEATPGAPRTVDGAAHEDVHRVEALLAAGFSPEEAAAIADQVAADRAATEWQPQAPTAPSPEDALAALPAGTRELADLRTWNTQTYETPAGERVVRAVLGPLNYQDATGAWQPIDTALVADGLGFANVENVLASSFAVGGVVTYRAGGHEIVWAPAGLGIEGASGEASAPRASVHPTASPALEADDTVVYRGLFPGADDRHRVFRGGAKHDVVVHDRPAGSGESYAVRGTLALPPGLSLATDAGPVTHAFDTIGGLRVVGADGEPVLLLEPVVAYDAGVGIGARDEIRGRYAGSVGADGLVSLAMLVPLDWMRAGDRPYPVTIDPTVRIPPLFLDHKNVHLFDPGIPDFESYEILWGDEVGLHTVLACHQTFRELTKVIGREKRWYTPWEWDWITIFETFWELVTSCVPYPREHRHFSQLTFRSDAVGEGEWRITDLKHHLYVEDVARTGRLYLAAMAGKAPLYLVTYYSLSPYDTRGGHVYVDHTGWYVFDPHPLFVELGTSELTDDLMQLNYAYEAGAIFGNAPGGYNIDIFGDVPEWWITYSTFQDGPLVTIEAAPSVKLTAPGHSEPQEWQETPIRATIRGADSGRYCVFLSAESHDFPVRRFTLDTTRRDLFFVDDHAIRTQDCVVTLEADEPGFYTWDGTFINSAGFETSARFARGYDPEPPEILSFQVSGPRAPNPDWYAGYADVTITARDNSSACILSATVDRQVLDSSYTRDLLPIPGVDNVTYDGNTCTWRQRFGPYDRNVTFVVRDLAGREVRKDITLRIAEPAGPLRMLGELSGQLNGTLRGRVFDSESLNWVREPPTNDDVLYLVAGDCDRDAANASRCRLSDGPIGRKPWEVTTWRSLRPLAACLPAATSVAIDGAPSEPMPVGTCHLNATLPGEGETRRVRIEAAHGSGLMRADEYLFAVDRTPFEAPIFALGPWGREPISTLRGDTHLSWAPLRYVGADGLRVEVLDDEQPVHLHFGASLPTPFCTGYYRNLTATTPLRINLSDLPFTHDLCEYPTPIPREWNVTALKPGYRAFHAVAWTATHASSMNPQSILYDPYPPTIELTLNGAAVRPPATSYATAADIPPHLSYTSAPSLVVDVRDNLTWVVSNSYRVNHGPWINGLPSDADFAQSGNYEVGIRSTDRANNTAERVWRFRVDVSPPYVRAEAVVDGNLVPDLRSGWYPHALDVTLRCDDAGGVGCAHTEQRTEPGPFSPELDLTFATPGLHTVEIHASDRAGWESPPRNLTLGIDPTPARVRAGPCGDVRVWCNGTDVPLHAAVVDAHEVADGSSATLAFFDFSPGTPLPTPPPALATDRWGDTWAVGASGLSFAADWVPHHRQATVEFDLALHGAWDLDALAAAGQDPRFVVTLAGAATYETTLSNDASSLQCYPALLGCATLVDGRTAATRVDPALFAPLAGVNPTTYPTTVFHVRVAALHSDKEVALQLAFPGLAPSPQRAWYIDNLVVSLDTAGTQQLAPLACTLDGAPTACHARLANLAEGVHRVGVLNATDVSGAPVRDGAIYVDKTPPAVSLDVRCATRAVPEWCISTDILVNARAREQMSSVVYDRERHGTYGWGYVGSEELHPGFTALGPFGTAPGGPSYGRNATLNLTWLPPHRALVVTFDLVLAGEWEDDPEGAARVEVLADGRPVAVERHARLVCPGLAVCERHALVDLVSGASGQESLARVRAAFEHNASTLDLTFASLWNGTPERNEFWLANVLVEADVAGVTTLTCRANAEPIPCHGPRTLPSGTIVTAEATDAAGNVASATFVAQIDGNPPDVRLLHGSEEWRAQPFAILTCDDGPQGSGCAETGYERAGLHVPAQLQPNGTWHLPLPAASDEYFYATDVAGNTRWGGPISVRYDPTPPTIEFTLDGTLSASAANTYTSAVRILTQCRDDESGCHAEHAGAPNGPWSSTPPAHTTDGTHTGYVRAMNRAGLASSTQAYSFDIDTTGVEITISLAPAPGTIRTTSGWWNGPVDATITTSEPATVEYRWRVGQPKTAYNGTPVRLDLSGIHNLEVEARDAAGNLATASATAPIDMAPPYDVKLVGWSRAGPVWHAGTGWVGPDTRFLVSGKDSDSGLGRLALLVDGVETTNSTVPFVTAVPWPASAGPHLLSAVAVDRAGHRTEGPVTSYTYDNTPPDLRPKRPGGTLYPLATSWDLETGVTLTAGGTVDLVDAAPGAPVAASTVWWRYATPTTVDPALRGASAMPTQNQTGTSVPVPGGSGVYRLVYGGADAVGNVLAEREFVFAVDAHKPKSRLVSFTGDVDDPRALATFRVDEQDAIIRTGLDRFEVFVHGVQQTFPLAGANSSTIEIDLAAHKGKIIVLAWYAVDRAGNVEARQSLRLVIDKMRPAIAAPSAFYPVAQDGDGARVTYAMPTVTDDIGVKSLTCTPASGTYFAVGRHTRGITCRAVDLSNNEGWKTIDVVVTQPDATFEGLAFDGSTAAADAAPGDEAGASMALLAGSLLVGRPGAGRATLFGFDGARWIENATLAPPESAHAAGFGQGVALWNNFAAVTSGAPGSAGAVHVYRNDSGAWTYTTTLASPSASPDDGFGAALAFRADRLVVGAPGDDAAEPDAGRAFAFAHDAGAWTLAANLTDATPAAGAHFGAALAYAGTTLLIGSPDASPGGRVVPFDDALVRQTAIVDAQGAPGDRFGASLDTSYHAALVGAPGARKAVLLYGNLGTWTHTTTLVPAAPGEGAGQTVTLTEGLALVGAPAAGAGQATIFRRTNGTWAEESRPAGAPAAEGARFGAALAANGRSAWVGAPGAGSAGAVYRFVADATPPVFGAYGDVVFAATSAAGATVPYAVPTVTDDVDGPIPPNCTPASGTYFGVGRTTVACAARDAAGNTATVRFDVLVTEPPAAVPAAAQARIRLPTATAQLHSAFDASGDVFLVGDPGARAAYVYTLEPGSATQWQHTATLQGPDPENPGTSFGGAVALEGELAFVSYTNTSGNHVLVFSHGAGSWSMTSALRAPEGQSSFGSSLAASGHLLAVGARDTQTLPNRPNGAVHVYALEGAEWRHEARLAPYYWNGISARCGADVDLSGGTLIFGCPGKKAANVYLRIDGAWSHAREIGNEIGFFGSRVALYHDFAVVNAPPSGPWYAPVPASAHTYARSGDAWTASGSQQGQAYGNATAAGATGVHAAIDHTYYADATAQITKTLSAIGASGARVFVADAGEVVVMGADLAPPRIDLATAYYAEATGPDGAIVTYAPIVAWDEVAGPLPAADCTPASGTLLPLGETPLTCRASDPLGNEAILVAPLFVRDTIPPAITPRAAAFVEATGPAGAAYVYEPPVWTDAVDGQGLASCDIPNGTTLPLGTSRLSCSASDAAGNVRQSAWDVIVRDSTPPTIGDAPDVIVPATERAGTAATFDTPRWTDAVDGEGPTACTHASGALYPPGETTVTCNVTDAAGNANSTAFVVNVVARAPYAPPGLRAVGGPQRITLYWNASHDGGAVITGYVVLAGETPIASLAPSARQHTIGGLAADTAYTFGIAAVNAMGTGDSSFAADTTWPAPSPPRNLTRDSRPPAVQDYAISQADTAIGGTPRLHLAWTRPENGTALSYSVYRRVEDGDWERVVDDTWDTKSSAPDCPSLRSCHYATTAFNVSGESGPSNPILVRGDHLWGFEPAPALDVDLTNGSITPYNDHNGNGVRDAGEFPIPQDLLIACEPARADPAGCAAAASAGRAEHAAAAIVTALAACTDPAAPCLTRPGSVWESCWGTAAIASCPMDVADFAMPAEIGCEPSDLVAAPESKCAPIRPVFTILQGVSGPTLARALACRRAAEDAAGARFDNDLRDCMVRCGTYTRDVMASGGNDHTRRNECTDALVDEAFWMAFVPYSTSCDDALKDTVAQRPSAPARQAECERELREGPLPEPSSPPPASNGDWWACRTMPYSGSGILAALQACVESAFVSYSCREWINDTVAAPAFRNPTSCVNSIT